MLTQEPDFAAYIMASQSGTLYIGSSVNLPGRVFQHKTGAVDGFSKKYGCTKLVYFRSAEHLEGALLLERRWKGWIRSKKEALIRSMNPRWDDLATGWFGEEAREPRDPSRL